MASNEVKVTEAAPQLATVPQPTQSSWFRRHWLMLLIIAGFCAFSAPFLMSMMQIMKEMARIFQDLGDGASKVIDIVAAALGAIIDNCEQQKTPCVVVEIVGSIVGGLVFVTWLAKSAMQIRNGLRGDKDKIPVDNLPDRPANRLASLEAERSGTPESEQRRRVNADVLKAVEDRVQAAKKSYSATGAPFTDVLKYQIAEALAQSEINKRAQNIAADDKLSPELRKRATDLATLSGIERDAAKERAVNEAVKDAKTEPEKEARKTAIDGVFAEK